MKKCTCSAPVKNTKGQENKCERTEAEPPQNKPSTRYKNQLWKIPREAGYCSPSTLPGKAPLKLWLYSSALKILTWGCTQNSVSDNHTGPYRKPGIVFREAVIKELQITDLGDSQLPKATLVAFRKLRVEAFLSSPIKIVTKQGKFFHLHWRVSRKKQVAKCRPSYDTALHSRGLRAPDWLYRTGNRRNTQHSSPSPLPGAMNQC